MTPAQKLRIIADSMGLDGYAESIREIANDLEQAPAPAVPQGWKLVPVEPTREMLNAMECQWLVGSQVDMAKREYSAMIEAAPAAPAQEPAVNLSCKSTQARLAAQWGYVPAPSQPVNRPQNCGTSYCSCIECVCEPSQPVTLTDEWVSVGDQKPPTNKPVLLHYLDEHQRSKIVRAHYIPAKTVEAGEDDAAEEYDAESDTYFVQDGWYEDNSESEVNYGITGQITHWRNLPLVPAIIAALREKESLR